MFSLVIWWTSWKIKSHELSPVHEFCSEDLKESFVSSLQNKGYWYYTWLQALNNLLKILTTSTASSDTNRVFISVYSSIVWIAAGNLKVIVVNAGLQAARRRSSPWEITRCCWELGTRCASPCIVRNYRQKNSILSALGWQSFSKKHLWEVSLDRISNVIVILKNERL